jgi:general L-amino acid transport system permease protein
MINDAILPLRVAAREPPITTTGALAWLRRNLFGGVANSAATLGVGMLVALALWHLIDWAVISAVWRPDLTACRALDHSGACWGVIAEKFRVIFFGRYPFGEQWRPLIATLLMLLLIIASCYPGTRSCWACGRSDLLYFSC